LFKKEIHKKKLTGKFEFSAFFPKKKLQQVIIIFTKRIVFFAIEFFSQNLPKIQLS